MKYFTEMKLSGYKSIQDVTLKLNPGINILIGPNGGGKSNLLKFISYLKDEVPKIETPYSINVKWIGNTVEYVKSVSQELNLDIEEHYENSRSDAFDLSDYISRNVNYKLSKNGKVLHSFEGEINEDYVIDKLDDEDWKNLIENIVYIKFQNVESVEFLSYPKSVRLLSHEIIMVLSTQLPFSHSIGLPMFRLRKLIQKAPDASITITEFKKQFRTVNSLLIKQVKTYIECPFLSH